MAHFLFSKEQFWQFLICFLSCLLLLPVLVVLGSWFFPAADGLWAHLIDTVLWSYISNSLLLMISVAALSLILGVIPAWFVTMYKFPGRSYLQWALLLPMSMPAYIIAYTYTGILDVSGPLQSWLRDITGWQYQDYWFPEPRSLGGAIILLSLVLYPYVYMLTRTAFLSQSICVLEIARTLRCSPWQSFFRIALPLARPAMVAGVTLVMMETLADYGTVQYFGLPVLTTGIFRIWFGLGNSMGAAQLSALMLLFVWLFIQLEAWSRRQGRFYHTSSRYSEIQAQTPSRLMAWQMTLICLLPVCCGFLIPVYFLSKWAWLTYPTVIDASFHSLIVNSIALAAVATLVTLSVAILFAYGKRCFPSTWIASVVRLSSLGYATPGAVIAIGVMLPFAWLDHHLDAWLMQYFHISSGLFFSGTLLVLVFAYLARFLAVSLNAVEAGLSKIKPAMDEMGRLSGVGYWTMLRRIYLPIIRGAGLTAALLVFVEVLKELPATLILRPFNFNTLAVKTYELANEERLAAAACPSLLLVLAGILPVILISRSISKSRPGNGSRTLR